MAEGIVERFDNELVSGAQTRLDRRVQVQQGDDGRRGRETELNVKVGKDEQKRTPMSICGRSLVFAKHQCSLAPGTLQARKLDSSEFGIVRPISIGGQTYLMQHIA